MLSPPPPPANEAVCPFLRMYFRYPSVRLPRRLVCCRLEVDLHWSR